MTTSALSRMLETVELSAVGGILKKFPQRGHILTTAHVRELVIGNVVRRVLSRSARMRRGSRRHVRRHTADARRAGGAGGRLRRADRALRLARGPRRAGRRTEAVARRTHRHGSRLACSSTRRVAGASVESQQQGGGLPQDGSQEAPVQGDHSGVCAVAEGPAHGQSTL
ncbi:hypothetical protein PF011_g15576 [Phytophthora fragariae]|uniref:Uncharacterized protein n=1 Tax=Phytophthora fragariae TaxID=53985 RepID=A0A6A3JV81_9STRA|nr:hypothetical protein PF011_g15576 [Phytophthora fragariae]